MLLVAVTFEIVPERAEAFRDRVGRQAADSLAEPGCRRFDVWCDTGNCCRVFLFEIYGDRAAFDAHLASRHFRDFDAEVEPWVESKKVELWTVAEA
jgi:(4S)-4-hydroxy-5-phosphonooxypentane-2,3-dione isomerase